MPIRKIRLSTAEARKHSSYLNQLRAEHIDLGADAEDRATEEEVSTLEITQGSDHGIICDFAPMNTIYVLSSRIVAWERTTVVHCRIESSWDDLTIELPCLREHKGAYHLGRLTYSVNRVLNDHFDRPFTMRRGDILEAVILAYGCEPIPDEVRGGLELVQFTLVDTLGRESQAHLELTVERRRELEVSINPPADLRRRGSLRSDEKSPAATSQGSFQPNPGALEAGVEILVPGCTA